MTNLMHLFGRVLTFCSEAGGVLASIIKQIDFSKVIQSINNIRHETKSIFHTFNSSCFLVLAGGIWL